MLNIKYKYIHTGYVNNADMKHNVREVRELLKYFWQHLNNFQKQPTGGVLKKRCSEVLMKLLSNFIEIALRHGCSPVNLLHIFRTPFTKNRFGRLLLNFPNGVDTFTKYTLFFYKIQQILFEAGCS